MKRNLSILILLLFSQQLFQIKIYSESWRWNCFWWFDGIDCSRVVFESRKLCEPWCLNLLAHLMTRSKEILFADMLSTANGQNEWYQTNDQMLLIQREAVNIAKPGARVPLLAFLGLDNPYTLYTMTSHLTTDSYFIKGFHLLKTRKTNQKNICEIG